ncbi:MAG: hypothetical protein P8Q91_04970 [Porticoccaceae bacterium]|nr:hypothetical protein [Porticoccaceae bacterium]
MSELKSIVVSYRPRLVYLALAACAALLVLVLWLGRLWGGQTFIQEMAEKQRLEILTDGLNIKVIEQQEELSRIRLNAKVDLAALENSRQEMIVLQRSIYKRDEELKLYRELLRDKDQPDGLSVADLRLTLLDDGRVDYRWVARQKTVKMKTLQILGELWLLGVQDGESVEISFQDLDAEIAEFPLRLEFKYFSINRGLLSLPENFEPQQIRIVLRYPWMEKAQFDNKFAWKIEE